VLLASHPNLECASTTRSSCGSRAIGFLTDFTRLNHRMHNKSFTVDNLATIVGAATSPTSTSRSAKGPTSSTST
jgi:phosphatidylserine/phosphatidylglycerophosphate/cardiolipin synthase-like enzyme